MTMTLKKHILILAVLLFSTLSFASTVNVLFLNDYHGQIHKTDKTAGLIQLVSYIENYRKKNPNTVVVAGGDNYQGTVISNLTYGAVVNKMFKLIGLTASSVGNHEFDWGIKYFSRWQKTGDFTYLAANIYNKSTGKPVSWAKPYKIVDLDGFKIAFIGLATIDTPNTTLMENIKHLNFTDPAKAAQKWIDYLNSGKAPQGKPDYIIALTHIPSDQNANNNVNGKEISELINNTKGLNAVLSGHSHQVVNGTIDNVPVIQAGSHGNNLGEIILTVDDKSKKVKNAEFKTIDLLSSKQLPPNKEAEKIYSFYTSKLKKLTKKVIGYSTGDIPNSAPKYHLAPMGATVCMAINRLTDTQVVIMNQWGIRNSLHKGKITFGDLYSVLPFDNTIVTFELSGKDLIEQIEHSITLQGGAFYGVNVVYDPSKPEGDRILDITLNDKTPIEDNKYYKIGINNFMYTGGDSYSFKNARNVIDTQLSMRDAVDKYIMQNKKISPVNTDYLKIVK